MKTMQKHLSIGHAMQPCWSATHMWLYRNGKSNCNTNVSFRIKTREAPTCTHFKQEKLRISFTCIHQSMFIYRSIKGPLLSSFSCSVKLIPCKVPIFSCYCARGSHLKINQISLLLGSRWEVSKMEDLMEERVTTLENRWYEGRGIRAKPLARSTATSPNLGP